MSLRDLLYLCAYCGDDTRIVRETVRCDSCGRTYEVPAGSRRVRVADADGTATMASYDDLADRIASATGASTTHPADAVARFARVEHAVHHLGELIGFFEERGAGLAGRLTLAETTLRLDATDGEVHEWPLRDLRAVQTASGAIQVATRDGILISFRMISDSPRRWEHALKDRLQHVWRTEGRGEITEFQPRIRSR